MCVPAVLQSTEAAKELSEEERADVLQGDVSLNGIAERIRSGRAANIVVVCGTARGR